MHRSLKGTGPRTKFLSGKVAQGTPVVTTNSNLLVCKRVKLNQLIQGEVRCEGGAEDESAKDDMEISQKLWSSARRILDYNVIAP